ncbi:aldo/keto reductase [Changpingibacter yushuensis]|uniref:aldo/keto reductase n=1 Tax=Changpingibacter yushuensis TaxID=2758440 RepID=UPI00165E016D|nr:aldo/keto reductase [Changpingibacter yushuensis]
MTHKQLVPLGETGVSMSRLTLGGNTFGWTSSKEEAFSVLDAFRAAGGNSIDTADSYSSWAPGNHGGESETILGAWLAERGLNEGDGRDSVVIATKVSQHPEFSGLAPENIAAACDASLQRLGLGYVDIYFAHFDDPSQKVSDMAEAFSALVDAGKVRAIGLSNFSPARMREWLDYTEQHELHRPTILQQKYNLVERLTFEAAYAPIAAEYGMATESYYALASGFLTGKYRNAEDAAQNAARGSAAKEYVTPDGLAVIDALVAVAEEANSTPTTVAIAWQLAKGVSSPIASARTVEQLPELTAALDLDLSVHQVIQLDNASRPFAVKES